MAADSGVGPVLTPGVTADAIVAAVEDAHPEVVVDDRGAYIRIRVPGRCTVDRADIESRLRRRFELPADLEAVMPAFRGRISISDDRAEWTSSEGRP